MELNGVEWNGVEWSGVELELEWSGVDWVAFSFAKMTAWSFGWSDS